MIENILNFTKFAYLGFILFFPMMVLNYLSEILDALNDLNATLFELNHKLEK